MVTTQRIALAGAAVAGMVLATGGMADAQAGYTAVDLTPGFDGFSCANAINDAGQIAGETYDSAGRAVRWNADLSMTDLGTLPGGTYAESNGINNLGDVVGTSEVTGGAEHAFFWDASSGTMADIHPPMADLDSSSEASGVNDQGQVVGQMITGGGQPRGFLYDPAGPTWTNLGTLGGFASNAKDVNNSGYVTGWADSAGGREPFLWDPNTSTMSGLGTLGGGQGLAFSINDANQVAGWSDLPSGDAWGFVWDQTMAGRAPLAGNDTAEAIGIAENGTAIGDSLASGPNVRLPVYWMPGTEAATELPTLGGDIAFGSGINSAGQGVGCSDLADPQAQQHAVLWQPPATPPSTTTTNPSTSTTAANAAVVTPAFTG